MKITLELDENPSTGYRWESDPKPSTDEYHSGQPADTPVEEIRIGGGGTRIVTYVDPPDEIKLNLRRSFEDKPPVEVVTVLHHSRR